jgi:hypothetical protein
MIPCNLRGASIVDFGVEEGDVCGETAVKSIITLDQIEELDFIHQRLDTAVLASYGWPQNLSDGQMLERPLALNLARAGR